MKIALVLLSVLSLASICVGASWIYPPAGPIVGGALVWIELIRSGGDKAKPPERNSK